MGGLEKKIDVNTIVGVVSFKTRQKDQQVCMPFFFKIIIINYLKPSLFFYAQAQVIVWCRLVCLQ